MSLVIDVVNIQPFFIILGFIITAVTFSFLYFKWNEGMKGRVSIVETKQVEHEKDINDVSSGVKEIKEGLGRVINRLTIMETKMEFFWKMVQTDLPLILKQPIHKEKDDLLDEFMNGNITEDHSIKLKSILKTELDELKYNGNKDPKILAYILVLARLEQNMYENAFKGK